MTEQTEASTETPIEKTTVTYLIVYRRQTVVRRFWITEVEWDPEERFEPNNVNDLYQIEHKQPPRSGADTSYVLLNEYFRISKSAKLAALPRQQWIELPPQKVFDDAFLEELLLDALFDPETHLPSDVAKDITVKDGKAVLELQDHTHWDYQTLMKLADYLKEANRRLKKAKADKLRWDDPYYLLRKG